MGCLVWFALVLVVAVVFLALRPTIVRAWEASGISALFRGQAGAEPTATGPQPREPSDGTGGPVVVTTAHDSPAPDVVEGDDPLPATPESPPQTTRTVQPEPAGQPDRPATTTRTGEPADSRPATPASTAPTRRTRSSTLYFVRQGDEGVALAGLTREVSYVDAPLTDTLEALLGGPTASEKAKGYLTLIPEGTHVESVQVRGETAYVSFNEHFRINPYGRDGLEAQLRQVVWTVTEFGTVKAVQILIAGEVTDYLGPEGLRISSPLTRESLGSL